MNTKEEVGRLETAENCLEFYQTEDWFELLEAENYERDAEARIFDLRDSVKYVLANGETDIAEKDADTLIHFLDGLETASNQFLNNSYTWDMALQDISHQIHKIESLGFYIFDEAVELSETIDEYLESSRSETKEQLRLARNENLANFFKPLREINNSLKSLGLPSADFGTLTKLYFGVDSDELTLDNIHLKTASLASFRIVFDGEPEVLQTVLDTMRTLSERLDSITTENLL